MHRHNHSSLLGSTLSILILKYTQFLKCQTGSGGTEWFRATGPVTLTSWNLSLPCTRRRRQHPQHCDFPRKAGTPLRVRISATLQHCLYVTYLAFQTLTLEINLTVRYFLFQSTEPPAEPREEMWPAPREEMWFSHQTGSGACWASGRRAPREDKPWCARRRTSTKENIPDTCRQKLSKTASTALSKDPREFSKILAPDCEGTKTVGIKRLQTKLLVR